MKKLFLSFLILLISIQTKAYESGPGFYAEFGKDFYNSITYTDIEIHYIFKFWEIELMPYGGTKTWFTSKDNVLKGGNPFLDTYSFGAKIMYDNITIVYNHYCAHPVSSYYDGDYSKKHPNEKAPYYIEDGVAGGNSDMLIIRYAYN